MPRVARTALTVLALALPAAPAAAPTPTEPLHLVFPDLYQTWADVERRQYVLGVVDARASALIGNSRLPAFVECVVGRGIGRIRQVLEVELIPRPGAAGTPMPFLVDQAIAEACR